MWHDVGLHAAARRTTAASRQAFAQVNVCRYHKFADMTCIERIGTPAGAEQSEGEERSK